MAREDGWRRGPRDDVRRTRPQLIPWRDLDCQERDKDVKAIVELPRMLAENGYEVVRVHERG